jgi:monoterpene epsilon-lactone hydrolase
MAPAMLEGMAALYMGDRDRRAPFASPLYADLRGLPPLLIQVGTCETLLSDAQRFAERARTAGVEVILETYEDQSHVWQVFASCHEVGQRAIDRIGEFVRTAAPG